MGRGVRRCALPLRQWRRAMDSCHSLGVRNSADGGRDRNRVQRSSTRTTHNLHAGTLDHVRRWANLAKALSPAAKVGASTNANPLSRANSAGFFTIWKRVRTRGTAHESHSNRGNPSPARLLRDVVNQACTNSCHPPVDWLHSIENTRVASGDFSLTKKLEGVEQ
jgi:hypothetical protein